jgi:alkylation response protein AidB-like acyl-CoA dehydrogenase
MDFMLSEEQEMFRAMFRDFSLKEIGPIAGEIDQEETLPPHILRKAANQGFLGATLPENYLGVNLDSVSYGLLIETLAMDCVSFAVMLATHVSAVAMSILLHGSDAQKEAWLPRMAGGEVIGAFALTEPDAGSDAMALQTRATADGDDVVLNGVKTWIANGDIAGVFLVFAQGRDCGDDGIEAFLVHKEAPGLTLGHREPTLGLRSVSFNTVYLEDCRAPLANRLGGPGEGWPIARRAQDRMAIALAAACVGVANDSVDVAAQFASERVQFGVPIAQKQAIQNHVAEAFIEVEALRQLVYRASWLLDQGGDVSADASAVKAFGARVARSVTNSMLQVLGGYGYMEDYPMARKYRDARMLGIIGGPTELHRVRVAQQVFAGLELEIAP